ncbi:sensor domain-containing diguanylate cyclase [Mycobacterium antarcticum]|uniref:sensor domain-containing diguanylate cyclase n=1 Tax=Mycolicibacterium sp. TUM20984 TaxID=3023368 RepID=UPI0023A26F3D|nr:GGDEF domain-containing protein [Mycolicibacterium sp. TUM20984]GLP82178.1 diguanylate cyclase [Mycolicibacterium sp. TUM20984]
MRREAAEPNRHAEELLEAAFEHLYNAMVITDADLDGGPFIQRGNPAFCAMTGYPEDELIGKSPRILQGPDTDRRVIDDLSRKIRAGEFFEGSTVNYRKDGSAYVVQWNISPVSGVDGSIVSYVSIQQDITARFAAERERSLLAEALNAATDPVIVTDRDFVIVFANSAFGRELGRPVEDLLGRSAFELRPRTADGWAEPHIRRVLRQGNPYHGVVSFELATGQRLHVDLSISSLIGHHDPNGHYVAIAPNITHMVEQQMALQEMADIDALTGLLNRRSGQVALDIEIQQAAESNAPVSVALGDIDHFKRINDHLGHAVGDDVLQSVAATLRRGMRSSDTAIRWGGEEFLILLPNTPLEDALPLADRVRTSVESSPRMASHPVTISFGVGQWRPGESIAAFVGRIDAAMYSAKSGGRNQVVSSP